MNEPECKSNMIKIAPTLFCADLLNLERDVRILDAAGMDLFHIDIMDGHFVPNYALNLDIVQGVRSITSVPMDVHLMVMDPINHIAKFSSAGVQYLSFHLETTNTPIRIARDIRSRGIKAGVAINPSTIVENLEYLLEEIDFVLLMAVEPGFSGQKFLDTTLSKIRMLNNIRNKKGLDFSIEVDGGIDSFNGQLCVKEGANILVAGALCIFRKGVTLGTAATQFRDDMNRR